MAKDTKAMTETVREAVAVRDTVAVTAPYDYGTDVGAGFEGTSQQDYAVPFLTILQALSPQCDPASGKYLPHARPGMLFNTVTQALYDAVQFIPCHRAHVYTEWLPRTAGGGFRGVLDVNDPRVLEAKLASPDAFGKLLAMGPDKTLTELVETFQMYGVLVAPEGMQGAVINFTSTQIKKYKAWMTKARTVRVPSARDANRQITPPLFAQLFQLTSVPESNAKGKWYGWKIEPAPEGLLLDPASERYGEARGFRQLAESGVLKQRPEDYEATQSGTT